MSLEPSAKRFGDYEILSLLGKGGMAEVYRARAVSGPREGWPVAIKRLLPDLAKSPEYVRLFTSEAELSKALDHPNIVKVYEAGIRDGVYFMAMELIDGRDLGQIIRRCKQRGIPLPLDFAVYLAKVILDALAYAHAAKGPAGEPLEIVHSDVSPSNVFISRVGEIKLGDFGIARAAATLPPELVGKSYYLSPESIDGKVSVAADLWAANVILYELLTLERPFVGANPQEVFASIRERRYLPLRQRRPDASPELEKIVRRGFAFDVKQRFGSAQEFARSLEPHYDEKVGTPLAIAAVVRGLFGAGEGR